MQRPPTPERTPELVFFTSTSNKHSSRQHGSLFSPRRTQYWSSTMGQPNKGNWGIAPFCLRSPAYRWLLRIFGRNHRSNTYHICTHFTSTIVLAIIVILMMAAASYSSQLPSFVFGFESSPKWVNSAPRAYSKCPLWDLDAAKNHEMKRSTALLS